MDLRSRPKRILVVVLPLVMLSLLMWVFFHKREPSYQGKTLSQWLKGYDETPFGNTEINQAVCHMGNDAIPHLEKMIAAKDSKLKEKLMVFAAKVFPGKMLITPDFIIRKRAYAGAGALGREALPMVPLLIRSVETEEGVGRDYAALALGRIGPVATESVINHLAKSTNWQIRRAAAFALSGFPEIINTQPLAYSEQERSSAERLSIPVLLKLQSDTNQDVRASAISAFLSIHEEPEIVVPALVNRLNDPLEIPRNRTKAAGALSTFGTQARQAIPSLLTCLTNSDLRLRIQATNALKKIDPEAAAKAGIK